jgi:hypothetical protein
MVPSRNDWPAGTMRYLGLYGETGPASADWIVLPVTSSLATAAVVFVW